MANISIKRKVPSPDSFVIKKRQVTIKDLLTDTVNKSLIEQSKGLTDLAAKIGQAIMAPPQTPSAPSAAASNASLGIQPMLSAIGFALGAVPEHAQLECLIGVLQYINDFSKKNK
ncbi:unnamed protein product [Lasius platythorax]|uniref:Uncharacterized protein n=1 Tax=Lasius platythorax TaxID=488582 RepID=A0AAV2NPC7_9HYME